jgi:peptidoglycan/LPS O-acetylase OafA/YrhL
VLSCSYKERILSGVISKKDFYIARIARVFPLHLLTFIIAIPVAFYFSINFFAKAGLNLFLLQSFIPYQPIYFSMNAVSWSISDEMFFYLLFPFLLPLLSAILSKRKTASFFLLGLVVAMVFMLNFVLPEQYKHPFLYISPIIRLVDFTIGILLYEVWLVLKGKTVSAFK